MVVLAFTKKERKRGLNFPAILLIKISEHKPNLKKVIFNDFLFFEPKTYKYFKASLRLNPNFKDLVMFKFTHFYLVKL